MLRTLPLLEFVVNSTSLSIDDLVDEFIARMDNGCLRLLMLECSFALTPQ